MGELEPYITREGIQLMIQAALEAYDAKVSAPRHAENQAEMHKTTDKLGELCTALNKLEGAAVAFKWIGGIVCFVWTLTEIAHTALSVVQTMHK